MRFLVGLCLALATAAPAAGAVVDHVATYARQEPLQGRAAQEVLRRHGDRIRIDSARKAEGARPPATDSVYTSPGQRVTFTLGRLASGQFAYLAMMEDPLSAPPAAARRVFSGAAETHLGQRCGVWQVVNPTPYNFDFVQRGCVTADGIELWLRNGPHQHLVATRVTRQRVSPSEVRLPVEALDLAAWVGPRGIRRGAAPASRDYEVVLEGEAGRHRRVMRRSGDWTHEMEQTWNRYVTVTVTNRAEGLQLRHIQDSAGARHLYIHRGPLADELGGPVRLAARPNETILRERCQWWDVMPNTADAGRLECRTADGVTLKVDNIRRAEVSTLVAVRLRRGLQPISAILPSRELVSPAAWGF